MLESERIGPATSVIDSMRVPPTLSQHIQDENTGLVTDVTSMCTSKLGLVGSVLFLTSTGGGIVVTVFHFTQRLHVRSQTVR